MSDSKSTISFSSNTNAEEVKNLGKLLYNPHTIDVTPPKVSPNNAKLIVAQPNVPPATNYQDIFIIDDSHKSKCNTYVARLSQIITELYKINHPEKENLLNFLHYIRSDMEFLAKSSEENKRDLCRSLYKQIIHRSFLTQFIPQNNYNREVSFYNIGKNGKPIYETPIPPPPNGVYKILGLNMKEENVMRVFQAHKNGYIFKEALGKLSGGKSRRNKKQRRKTRRRRMY
jgi:hypothetical protein